MLRRHLFVAAALVLQVVAAPSATAGPPVFLLSWGAIGLGPGQFDVMSGITVDENGFVYIADSDQWRIQKFSPDSSFVLDWFYPPPPGTIDPLLHSRLVGLASDGAGHIYVVDWEGDTVLKFTTSGEFVLRWGETGRGPGFLRFPTHAAVDGDGNVWVVDQFNDRVQKFSPTGEFLLSVGGTGTGPGLMRRPYGIASDRKGAVYVSDAGNHRVQKFLTDGSYVSQWGNRGGGAGGFEQPLGIGIDDDDRVFVVDWGNSRVQIFESNGTFLGEFGSSGDGPGQFSRPRALAVADDGTVYVGDTENFRVSKWGSIPTPTRRVTWGEIRRRYLP